MQKDSPKNIQKDMTVRCCISGGGPAGIMLGFLLARAGIETVVLEKWPDFFRDFRGDTIHPSVMEILHELGLLEKFLKLPHDEVRQAEGDIGNEKVIVADFTHLKLHSPFLAFIPQWDFLNFISAEAKKYPAFHLLMETEATDLIEENGVVVGVKAKNKEGAFDIRSELVVGADGRHSTVREKSGLAVEELSSPMDILWFRISRTKTDPASVLGKVDLGRFMIMINRTDYWQCGFVIPKGGFDEIKKAGLDAFRASLVALVPSVADRVGEIKDWDQVKLLTVTVDHLLSWHRPGLLCIGDSAHAMSPIGGVGINLAIQDAVGAANILVPAFESGKVTESDLAAVQKRRGLPVKIIQRLQVFIQNRVIVHVLATPKHFKLPWQIKLIKKFPYLRRIPAYFIGVGFRTEHVKTKSVL